MKTSIQQILPILSVSTKECQQMEGEELESLKTNIVEYLVKGTLLRDREKARKMRTQAAW